MEGEEGSRARHIVCCKVCNLPYESATGQTVICPTCRKTGGASPERREDDEQKLKLGTCKNCNKTYLSATGKTTMCPQCRKPSLKKSGSKSAVIKGSSQKVIPDCRKVSQPMAETDKENTIAVAHNCMCCVLCLACTYFVTPHYIVVMCQWLSSGGCCDHDHDVDEEVKEHYHSSQYEVSTSEPVPVL